MPVKNVSDTGSAAELAGLAKFGLAYAYPIVQLYR